jgi:hypothetical protein
VGILGARLHDLRSALDRRSQSVSALSFSVVRTFVRFPALLSDVAACQCFATSHDLGKHYSLSRLFGVTDSEESRRGMSSFATSDLSAIL